MAGAALIVEFRFLPRRPTPPSDFAPNAFVRIAPDNTVTIVAKHLEMGQGSHTGLATVVAEELDADWAQVRVEAAPSDATRYNNLVWGPVQGTGGSSAIANSWAQLRKAGATARAMLVAAAAAEVGRAREQPRRWTRASCRTPRPGAARPSASWPRPRRRSPCPPRSPLKDPKDFKLIGKAAPRVDSKAKTDGSARFTIDVYLPDMLTAVIARPPLFGATVKSIDKTAALKVPGVTDVVEVPAGVAVLGKGFWAARQGRAALQRGVGREQGRAPRHRRAPGRVQGPRREAGRSRRAATAIPPPAFAGAAKTLEAVYEFPYLAHAPMEPLDCVVQALGRPLRGLGRLADPDPRPGHGGAASSACRRRRSSCTRCWPAAASAGAPPRGRRGRRRRPASPRPSADGSR